MRDDIMMCSLVCVDVPHYQSAYSASLHGVVEKCIARFVFV